MIKLAVLSNRANLVSLPLGLCGSLLLTFGILGTNIVSKAAGYSFIGLGWWQRFLVATGTTGRGFLVAGAILLIIAWVWLLRSAPQPRLVVFNFVLWAIPLLLGPSVFSDDLYAYGDQGWALMQGLSPYQIGLTKAGGPWAELVGGTWAGTTTAYPPLSLRGQQLAVWLSAGSIPAAVALMKLQALLGVALAGWAIYRLAIRRGYHSGIVLCWVLLNPVMIIHLVAGGHNDAWMVGLVALAMLVADRRHGWVGAAILAGVASAVKQPGILVALPAVLLSLSHLKPLVNKYLDRFRAVGMLVAASALAVLTSVLIHLICGLGWGWTKALSVPGSVTTWAPSSMLGLVAKRAAAAAGLTNPAVVMTPVRYAVLAGLAIGLAVLAWRWRRNPLVLAGLGFSVLALAGAGLRTWYLAWGIGLLVLGGGRRIMASAAALMASLVVADAFQDYLRFDMVGELVVGITAGVAVYLAVAEMPWPARPEPKPGRAQEG